MHWTNLFSLNIEILCHQIIPKSADEWRPAIRLLRFDCWSCWWISNQINILSIHLYRLGKCYGRKHEIYFEMKITFWVLSRIQFNSFIIHFKQQNSQLIHFCCLKELALNLFHFQYCFCSYFAKKCGGKGMQWSFWCN